MPRLKYVVPLLAAMAFVLLPAGASANISRQHAVQLNGLSVSLANKPMLTVGVAKTLKMVVGNTTASTLKRVRVLFEPGEVLSGATPGYRLVTPTGRNYKAGIWLIKLAAHHKKTFYVRIMPPEYKTGQPFLALIIQAGALGSSLSAWQRVTLHYSTE